jgi:hypothetical protein
LIVDNGTDHFAGRPADQSGRYVVGGGQDEREGERRFDSRHCLWHGDLE